MTLLLRAIVRAADLDRYPGDLVAVSAGDLSALATPRDRAPEASETELRAHDGITNRIHEAGPSLPSRFGQVFENESDLARSLAARHDELAGALAKIGDRVEMSVTLAWRDPGIERATPARDGREYMRHAARRERSRSEAESLVARLLSDLADERALSRHRTCPREGLAAIVTLLVDRDAAPRVHARVDEFDRGVAEVHAAVSGRPVPPYSFVS